MPPREVLKTARFKEAISGLPLRYEAREEGRMAGISEVYTPTPLMSGRRRRALRLSR